VHPADPDRAAPTHQIVELGQVGKPHGIQGAVRARLHNPQSEALDNGAVATLKLLDGSELRRQLRVAGRGADHLILEVEGVVDRDGAERLRGALIMVERSTLAPSEDEQGSYYYHDLIGCAVLDETGRDLGRVTSLFEAGASDVLVVREGDTERYLPLVPDWVEAVDLEQRVIRLACPADDWESWEV
jgi:16S rRNA processing protein RimM